MQNGIDGAAWKFLFLAWTVVSLGS